MINESKFYTVIGAIAILYIIAYVSNIVKLTECDFSTDSKDFKCEVMHGIGTVIPPLSIFTVMYGTD